MDILPARAMHTAKACWRLRLRSSESRGRLHAKDDACRLPMRRKAGGSAFSPWQPITGELRTRQDRNREQYLAEYIYIYMYVVRFKNEEIITQVLSRSFHAGVKTLVIQYRLASAAN